AEAMLARSSDAIVAPSQNLLLDLVHRYRVVPTSKAYVVPDGIRVSDFRKLPQQREARRRFGIPYDRFVIGMIGRLVRVKNHRLMLDSIVELSRSRTGAFH